MIYLDHAATTPVPEEVAKAVYDTLVSGWGNPSSQYPFGQQAKAQVDAARGNWIAASGLDTGDSAIKTVVRELFPDVRATPYRAIEDLGEQGAKLLRDKMIGDDLDLESLIESVERL